MIAIYILLGGFLVGIFLIFTFSVHYENYIIRKRMGNDYIDWIKEEHSKIVNTKYETYLLNLIKRGGK
jgi:protein-S-isoprenylcysteine O-methyltransferase Ste14